MTSIDITLSVASALERSGIPYILVGSFSSNAYGIPRSTQDADFIIELGERPIGELIAQLPSGLAVDPQMHFETITGTYRYIGTHNASGFKVELFLLSSDPFHVARFVRRRQEVVQGCTVWLPTAEDVVIQKLRWFGLARRSKDESDARDVLAVQHPRLDLGYIRNWCDQHGTRELFERLLADAQRY